MDAAGDPGRPRAQPLSAHAGWPASRTVIESPEVACERIQGGFEHFAIICIEPRALNSLCQKKRHPQVPSQYRLRNESSAASVAHPSAAPLFQFVVLCDVEFPVANESDYTDGDKYRAYEEPSPINAPVRVHKLEAIIQDDCANPRKDDRAKQALTWRWADACRQMGLMPTCSFDGHAWSESGLGLRLVGCLYMRSASSMDDRQKLDVLTLALRAADCVIAHHVFIPLRGERRAF